MSEPESHPGPLMVAGYAGREGRSVSELLDSVSPTAPPVRVLVVALVAGLFPLIFPFAAWATVQYWRAPLSQRRWRWVSLVMLSLSLFNLVGFLAYGYGRHYSFG